MQITIRYTKDCPHADQAERNVREALRATGVGATITRELISTTAEADELGFFGSPTILIDGIDPFVTPGAQPGLACRLYQGSRGTPDVRELTEALRGRT